MLSIDLPQVIGGAGESVAERMWSWLWNVGRWQSQCRQRVRVSARMVAKGVRADSHVGNRI